ncbi:hypothetical protein [Saccharopolyspora phatthalungensis]|uniref:Uncharacterized protein n=1 Tax=Saccharopolyspora phatthalungensis TaxID=664693 RepID=A0A840Q4Q0_9PSEU|nr:hypothetical protein [Saccharopolyspora phatthalungensis]MBB5154957.1 hypothetical protein [Saccharopolyspora phatthalungensis]
MSVTRAVRDADDYGVRNLGHVLVTIDDLEALLAVTRSLDPENQATLAFDGGSFSEAEDLRSLSDDELRSVWITGRSGFMVTLNANQARVRGSKRERDAVYKWARARRTRLRSNSPADRLLSGLRIFVSLTFLVTLVSGTIGLLQKGETPAFLVVTYILTSSITCVVMWTLHFIFGSSGAVLRAQSLEQYREDERSSQRHRQVGAISVAGVVVTLVIGVLGLILKK